MALGDGWAGPRDRPGRQPPCLPAARRAGRAGGGMAACERRDRRAARPADLGGGRHPHDLSRLHGREGGSRAGHGGGIRLPAPAARGDHVRAAEAGSCRGARRRRAPGRPRRRAVPARPALARDHRGVRGGPRGHRRARCRAGRTTRRSPRRAPAGTALPTVVFAGEDGRETVAGLQPLDAYRAGGGGAAERDGRTSGSVSRRSCAASAVSRPREVEMLCDLPGPRAHAELWRLAEDWSVRPVRVLTGWLWEAA